MPPQYPPAQSWEVLGGLRPLTGTYCAISAAPKRVAAVATPSAAVPDQSQDPVPTPPPPPPNHHRQPRIDSLRQPIRRIWVAGALSAGYPMRYLASPDSGRPTQYGRYLRHRAVTLGIAIDLRCYCSDSCLATGAIGR